MKNKIGIFLAITAIFTSSTALSETLTIPKLSTWGEFNCTSSSINPFAKINMDTKSVEVKGFCSGQPYVSSPGHIKGLPKSDLNEFYFEYQKEIYQSASIKITSSSNASLTCSIGRGNKTKSYGQGGYC